MAFFSLKIEYISMGEFVTFGCSWERFHWDDKWHDQQCSICSWSLGFFLYIYHIAHSDLSHCKLWFWEYNIFVGKNERVNQCFLLISKQLNFFRTLTISKTLTHQKNNVLEIFRWKLFLEEKPPNTFLIFLWAQNYVSVPTKREAPTP